ncbi:FecR family protein [Snuella lapsa]|uniref:FecR family protein n=1 Tax=Snuella lapsa TaxID=870481 RepID=A0ABP6Y1Z8_9FLAO
MSEHEYIDDLFKKFVDNSIDKDELYTFLDIIKDPKYKEYITLLMDKRWEDTTVSLDESKLPSNRINFVTLYRKAIKLIEQREYKNTSQHIAFKKKTFLKNSYKIAAVIVIALGVFSVFKYGSFEQSSNFESEVKPVIAPDAITLKLQNGNIEVITEGGEKTILDTEGNVVSAQKGNQLQYKNDKQAKLTKLVYNELNVPYGKHFDLLLSDGTQVKLNSGSSIKYPVQFIDGQERKVFLKGEAFFDVTKNTNNAFVVNTNDVNVVVYGTQFNVSYYPEDPTISTVLVEGSVALRKEEGDQNDQVLLKPGHKAAWDKTEKTIDVEQVDVELYTAWIKGMLVFKNTPFNHIRKKLERHFNVNIEDKYHHLENQIYTATFRDESITDILNAFQEDTPFEYLIEGDKITITKLNN